MAHEMNYPAPPGAAAGPGWMARPQGIPDCPPGLEYLLQVDQLVVKETVSMIEAFTGFEAKNKFVVVNAMGQQVFYAVEESGFCTRQCCGGHRGFTMHVSDNMGNEVMRARRDFKMCAGCCWCACIGCMAYEIEVESPPGTIIGYVRQSCSVIKPKFEIQDEDRETVLTISGPLCICECPCFDVSFDVFTNDGYEVGKISKQWTGILKEMFTEADNFGVSFPIDLSVKVKATLMSAVFLINMMYFEEKNSDNQHH